MGNKVITLTGPSCSGKSTLAADLEGSGCFKEVVSTTTRPIREGEVDGVDYYFVSKEDFESKISQDGFLEYTYFSGHYYGTELSRISSIIGFGKIPLLVLEPMGAREVKRIGSSIGWDVLSCYIDISIESQIERLLNRFKGDKSADISNYASRIMAALNEEREWASEMEYDNVIPSYDNESAKSVRGIFLSRDIGCELSP